MSKEQAVLVLRLAGPLQSWGNRSQFNQRDTQSQPTKSGLIGLLAAAQGRTRSDDIRDLVELKVGVRVDQAGSLLRDYHTTSDYRGKPLLSAQVNAKGIQKLTSPPKPTYVTQRYYLQDAVFVAALQGPAGLIDALTRAVRTPAFPLALGRRSCVPSQPLHLPPPPGLEQAANLEQVLCAVPWQAADHIRNIYRRRAQPQTVNLAATIEDEAGPDTAEDVPVSFAPQVRTWTTRRIRHTWLSVSTGLEPSDSANGPDQGDIHDPFALLGW